MNRPEMAVRTGLNRASSESAVNAEFLAPGEVHVREEVGRLAGFGSSKKRNRSVPPWRNTRSTIGPGYGGDDVADSPLQLLKDAVDRRQMSCLSGMTGPARNPTSHLANHRHRYGTEGQTQVCR